MSGLKQWLSEVPSLVVRLAAAFGALSLVLAGLAAVNPQWIESAVGLSPDGGSGESEWWLVAVFALAALTLLGGALAAHRARHAAAT
ncbi:hypothetical protein GCM10022199_01470 [Marihabitans asiaticum]|uniref:Uncharacterized protein n=1 Tax=Marihabitans asiaticum TaxID=415218 RepID=A0A560WGG4_9MICO|nr:hypothetical protein FB557_0100 [Marihabitans asiaticum]